MQHTISVILLSQREYVHKHGYTIDKLSTLVWNDFLRPSMSAEE